MPRVAKSLTTTTCTNARPIVREGNKFERVITDGQCPGLQLHVAPSTGFKSWRIKYKNHLGKTEFHVFDKFPNLSLADARIEANKLKTKLALPPQRPALTFKEVAEDWIHWKKNFAVKGKLPAKITIEKYQNYLENDLYPTLGELDINAINREVCSSLLTEIHSRTPAGADKCHQALNMIFKYAVKNNKKSSAVDLEQIISMENPDEFVMPSDLRLEYGRCAGMTSKQMQLASKLQHHIFLRSGEIMPSKWSEIEFEKMLWTIPAQRMKMKRTHSIPLSKQALNILRELKKLAGKSEFVFPNEKGDSHLVRDSLSKAFRDYKIPYTPHDCRTMAGSWLKNKGVSPFAIEVQLAHIIGNKVQIAYEVEQHKFFMEERISAMQMWSNFLEGIKSKSKDTKLCPLCHNEMHI